MGRSWWKRDHPRNPHNKKPGKRQRNREAKKIPSMIRYIEDRPALYSVECLTALFDVSHWTSRKVLDQAVLKGLLIRRITRFCQDEYMWNRTWWEPNTEYYRKVYYRVAYRHQQAFIWN